MTHRKMQQAVIATNARNCIRKIVSSERVLADTINILPKTRRINKTVLRFYAQAIRDERDLAIRKLQLIANGR